MVIKQKILNFVNNFVNQNNYLKIKTFTFFLFTCKNLTQNFLIVFKPTHYNNVVLSSHDCDTVDTMMSLCRETVTDLY